MAKNTRSDNRDKVYQMVTDKIVAMLEGGTVPWHRPWSAIAGLPMSLSTGKPYRGINPFLLTASSMAAGYESPWWGTYDQITARGGQIRKGEKSTLVVFWKRGTRNVTDEATGDEVEKAWAILRYFLVFNADQADGVKVPKAGEVIEHEPIAACEETMAGFLDNGGPTLRHGGDKAFYRPSMDLVMLPAREAFESTDAYYSTAFHELTHSTGAGHRLGREGIVEGHSFGDELYSREELIAEMGAAMLSGICGIEQRTIGQSASYIDHWLGVLRGDPKMVVQAAGHAQRATDLILGTTFEQRDAEPAAA